MDDDLGQFCCLNPDCPDHGKRGHGNLTVPMRYGPNKARRLLRCSTCKARFSERKGTPLFDARLPTDTAVAVLAQTRPSTWGEVHHRILGLLRDRIAIEQAKGVLAVQHDIGLSDAYTLLVTTAREGGIPLAERAERVVAGIRRPPSP